jgi:hypothetical protein
VLSALKLPSVTGSSSHPTGTGLGAILFGPTVMTVLGSVVLTSLERVGPMRYEGIATADGELVATVPFGAGWRVLVDGSSRPMLVDDGMIRVLDVRAGAEVELVAGDDRVRRLALRAQALVALLIVSLGARPPQAAVRNARRRTEVGDA